MYVCKDAHAHRHAYMHSNAQVREFCLGRSKVNQVHMHSCGVCKCVCPYGPESFSFFGQFFLDNLMILYMHADILLCMCLFVCMYVCVCVCVCVCAHDIFCVHTCVTMYPHTKTKKQQDKYLCT